MNKEKINTLDAAQGAGTMSAPESEISNIATVTIDKLNDKDEVVETGELKLEVVDEDTKDWQHTFWNVMWLAAEPSQLRPQRGRMRRKPRPSWRMPKTSMPTRRCACDTLYGQLTVCARSKASTPTVQGSG